MAVGSLILSVGKKNLNYCCGAGPDAEQALGTDAQCVVFASRDLIPAKPGIDDLRGCAMGCPHEPRTVQPYRGQIANAPRVAGNDLSSRVPAALAGPAPCDR